jgi:Ca2+-binding EF-hand superfamily protein
VGKLYKCFKSIDADGSGQVTHNEIFLHLHMEKTFFNKRIFSILDADGSGDLNFGEFLVGLWSYCSLEDKHFGE